MARKKKVDDVAEMPVENASTEVTEPVVEEAHATEVPETIDTPTVNSEDVPAVVEPVAIEKRIDTTTIEECKKEAVDQINRCTAFVVSGVDKTYGRIFEMSRAEWGMYYVNLEYYTTKKRSSFPEKPKVLEVP